MSREKIAAVPHRTELQRSGSACWWACLIVASSTALIGSVFRIIASIFGSFRAAHNESAFHDRFDLMLTITLVATVALIIRKRSWIAPSMFALMIAWVSMPPLAYSGSSDQLEVANGLMGTQLVLRLSLALLCCTLAYKLRQPENV